MTDEDHAARKMWAALKFKSHMTWMTVVPPSRDGCDDTTMADVLSKRRHTARFSDRYLYKHGMRRTQGSSCAATSSGPRCYSREMKAWDIVNAMVSLFVLCSASPGSDSPSGRRCANSAIGTPMLPIRGHRGHDWEPLRAAFETRDRGCCGWCCYSQCGYFRTTIVVKNTLSHDARLFRWIACSDLR